MSDTVVLPENLWDAAESVMLQVDVTLHLPVAFGGERCEVWDDAVRDVEGSWIPVLGDLLGWDMEQVNDQLDGDPEAAFDSMVHHMVRAGVTPWVIRAVTPVKFATNNPKVRSFSWGHTYSEWFAGWTYEDALARAFAWAETQEPISK